MIGDCAKKRVQVVIMTADDYVFAGENLCKNPQPVCPRRAGEGYEKCKTICQQEGHAEEMAMKAVHNAGRSLVGAKVYLFGQTHFCRNCQEKLFDAGVSSLERRSTEL